MTIESLDPIAEVPRKEILVRAGFWMLVFCVILCVGFIFLYRAEADKRQALRSASAWESVNISVRLIADEVSDTFSDLGYLASQNELSDLLQARRTDADRRLGTEYLAFLMNNRVYDQVRYIGGDGVEVVRANFNDGNPVIVPPDELQDKSSSYYFEHVMDLEPGQIYLSLFDLNLEAGMLEIPIKPTLRIGTPVRDAAGQKRGFVMLNYLGRHLIEKITAAGEASDVNTWLIDDQGHWLKGPETAVEWSFMYPEERKNNFRLQYPPAWQHLLSSDRGQFFYQGILFTFEKVFPCLLATETTIRSVSAPEDYHWTVVSTVPEDVLWADHLEIGQRLLVLYGLILVFLSPVSWLLARLTVRQKALATAMSKVLNNVPVLISYVDATQRIRFNNSAFGEFFGASQTQLNGQHLASVMEQEGYEHVRPYVERALRGEQVSFQQRISFKDTGTRVIAASYVPDINNDDSARGFFGVVNDITELNQAQERERQRLFELTHAQRINSMGEMVTEIAHEINQPLTTIANFSSACEHSVRSGQWDAGQLVGWITEIRTHAIRASEVVRRLRTFLKKGETEHKPTDINRLVQDVCGWMDGETRNRSINVSLDLQPGLPRVIADDILLEQVLLNLVRNAIEALSEKQEGDRKLVVKTSTYHHGVQVAVSDNGPGIPEHIDDRIFYSFITSKDQGLGLGLSVSRSIVEAHGGNLRVDRNATTMTTFVFTLPSNKEPDRD